MCYTPIQYFETHFLVLTYDTNSSHSHHQPLSQKDNWVNHSLSSSTIVAVYDVLVANGIGTHHPELYHLVISDLLALIPRDRFWML